MRERREGVGEEGRREEGGKKRESQRIYQQMDSNFAWTTTKLTPLGL